MLLFRPEHTDAQHQEKAEKEKANKRRIEHDVASRFGPRQGADEEPDYDASELRAAARRGAHAVRESFLYSFFN